MHKAINDKIRIRLLHTGNDTDTYYTESLYGFACQHYNDPHVLFKLKIKGYYQKLYKWSDNETEWFIENNLEESVKWSDGTQDYYYDWGIGQNQISNHPLHFPNLDHIVPDSISKDNRPQNFRIRCKRLNESKGNINSDKERWAVGVDNFKDMSAETQEGFLQYCKSIQKIT